MCSGVCGNHSVGGEVIPASSSRQRRIVLSAAPSLAIREASDYDGDADVDGGDACARAAVVRRP